MDEHERVLIERALERFRGNRKDAAAALNISSATLWRKMKQYGLLATRPDRADQGRERATRAWCV